MKSCSKSAASESYFGCCRPDNSLLLILFETLNADVFPWQWHNLDEDFSGNYDEDYNFWVCRTD